MIITGIQFEETNRRKLVYTVYDAELHWGRDHLYQLYCVDKSPVVSWICKMQQVISP